MSYAFICPACGVPHAGPWQHCSACKLEMDRGERPWMGLDLLRVLMQIAK